MRGKCAWPLLAMLLLSACGTIATPVWQASDPVVVVQVNTAQPTRIPSTSTPIPPTETPQPTSTPTVTRTATALPPTTTFTPIPSPLPPSPLPEPASASEFDRDAANGETLFNTFQADAGFACATCHRPDSEERLIGPGLLNIGTRAETRVEDLNAIEYIRTSIVDPSAYVVETFPDELMPQNWAEIYSEDEINDLIAYLLTLE